MCEKRTRKTKKGSQLIRLREARRLQRLQLITTPMPTRNESIALPPLPYRPVVDKVAQNRVIIDLAWKTIALMHKNKLIQQKIIALQKETSEFVASVMNNPQIRAQNQHIRFCGVPPAPVQMEGVVENKNIALKVEPDV